MPAYPTTAQLTQYELDELTMQAQKALMGASPYTIATVPVDAGKLLWMLEKLALKVR